MTLIPQNGNLLYKLELQGQQRRIKHIVRLLPLADFAHEFELLFWRMMRILALLGARSPKEAVQNWHRIVEERHPVNEISTLQWVIEQPLEIVWEERES